MITAQVVTRLYLGYHWLTDTLASVGLSMMITALAIAVDTHVTVRVPELYGTRPADGWRHVADPPRASSPSPGRVDGGQAADRTLRTRRGRGLAWACHGSRTPQTRRARWGSLRRTHGAHHAATAAPTATPPEAPKDTTPDRARPSGGGGGGDDYAPDPNRWKALVICLLGGGIVLLDVSIVNVALESISSGLPGASPEGRAVDPVRLRARVRPAARARRPARGRLRPATDVHRRRRALHARECLCASRRTASCS